MGIVPRIVFPALIGFVASATTEWSGAIQRWLAAFSARRDGLDRRRRYAIAAAVPLACALIFAVDDGGVAFKEQLLVLIGLGSSYLTLVSRDGDVLGAVRRLVEERA